MTTTVLGTSFNINTKDNGRISVSLLTGKVSVKPSTESEAIFLKPGEAINYHIASNKHQVSHFDIKETTAWREGWMIFNRASLSQVVNKLEDWYGVKIHLANSPKEEWQLSAEYQHQTLENVLKSLSYIQEFEFTINGKEIELKF
jgi:ferric-dicitrate binding protein FerR (iron transport regulator)